MSEHSPSMENNLHREYTVVKNFQILIGTIDVL